MPLPIEIDQFYYRAILFYIMIGCATLLLFVKVSFHHRTDSVKDTPDPTKDEIILAIWMLCTVILFWPWVLIQRTPRF